MSTLGLLLLPAVGGYWFLTHFNYTRFQSVRDSGYHVLFRSAVVGIVLYCIATGKVQSLGVPSGQPLALNIWTNTLRILSPLR